MKQLYKASKASWGTKAYNLALMQAHGLPVPAFSVYHCQFFDEAETLAYLKSQEALLTKQQTTLSDLSQTLQTWAKQQVLAESFDSVTELSSQNRMKTFSVRSSATVEDLKDTSFAGQFHTKLHVQRQDLIEAIAVTVASLYSESSLAYLRHQKIALSEAKMIVIIQAMVVGDISGIYFTANPQGILNEHVVVLGHGVGNLVVEDKVPTTTLTYYPTDDLTYYETWEDSPKPSEQQITALKEMSQSMMALFGPHLDIEFTFVEKKLFVLQARPITTLPKDVLEAEIILDNSNIVESYPGTTTPLTFSFIKEAYASVFRGLGRRIVGNRTKGQKKVLLAYEETFDEMIAMVNSRVYYQIHHWYQLLQLLPLSNKIIPVWQDMLGVRQTQVPKTPIHISGWQRLRFTLNILKEFFRTPKQMAQLETDFQHIEKLYVRDYSPTAEIKELQALFETIKAAVLDQWDITLMNDLYAFVFTGLFRHLTKDTPEAELELAGIEQIESMKPARAMYKLAKKVQTTPSYQKQLLSLENDQVLNFLISDQHPLTVEIEDYRQCYGNRVPEELKLETKTYQTHPDKLIKAILSYQVSKVISEKPNLTQLTTRHPFKNYVKKQALLGIQYRESSRLNRTRIYGMMRQIFLTIGERLVERGQLEQVEDIFWLEMNEVFTLNHSRDSSQDLVEERQCKASLDKQLPAVSRLVFVDEVIEKRVQSVNLSEKVSDQTWFNGIACSKGRIRGEVVRIDDISQITAKETQGKIIVTRMTDPGWVHLLAQAKGIIAERGSLLSHTAIISRELGIPSVVNVPGIMSALKSGDVIELDGQAGTVEKIVGGEISGD